VVTNIPQNVCMCVSTQMRKATTAAFAAVVAIGNGVGTQAAAVDTGSIAEASCRTSHRPVKSASS
jgi:hypothetical protein